MSRTTLDPASAVAFDEGRGGEEEGEGEEEGAKEEEETNALRRGTILRRCFGARLAVGEGMDEIEEKRAGIAFFSPQANYGSVEAV